MVWERQQNHYTLYVQRLPNGKKKVYGMIGVRTPDGANYVEPIQAETLALRDFEFDEVEETEGFPTKRDDGAGQFNLTRVGGDREFGGRT